MSLSKLKKRNMEAEQQRLHEKEKNNNDVQPLEESFTDYKDPSEDDQQKLPLPLLFVECPPESRVKISKDNSKKHMKLRTDHKFTMYDESYLFDCMGLTRTTSKELSRVLDPKITSFLQKNQLVKADPHYKRHADAVKATAVSKADTFGKEANFTVSDYI